MNEYKILRFDKHKYTLYTFDEGEKIPSYMKKIDFSKYDDRVIPAYMYAGEYKVFVQYVKDHKDKPQVAITLCPTEEETYNAWKKHVEEQKEMEKAIEQLLPGGIDNVFNSLFRKGL